MEKINKTKSCFFEKISKTTDLYTRKKEDITKNQK